MLSKTPPVEPAVSAEFNYFHKTLVEVGEAKAPARPGPTCPNCKFYGMELVKIGSPMVGVCGNFLTKLLPTPIHYVDSDHPTCPAFEPRPRNVEIFGSAHEMLRQCSEKTPHQRVEEWALTTHGVILIVLAIAGAVEILKRIWEAIH